MFVFQKVKLLLPVPQISLGLFEDAILLFDLDVEFISLLFLNNLLRFNISVHLLVLFLPRIIVLLLLFYKLFIGIILDAHVFDLLLKV